MCVAKRKEHTTRSLRVCRQNNKAVLRGGPLRAVFLVVARKGGDSGCELGGGDGKAGRMVGPDREFVCAQVCCGCPRGAFEVEGVHLRSRCVCGRC